MSKRVITMSGLGTTGQWGNQLIQYAFLRTYATRWGAELQVPEWAGQHIFGFQDAPIAENLPEFSESYSPAKRKRCRIPIPPAGDEFIGHDFRGYAQFHTSYYHPFLGTLLEMHTVKQGIMAQYWSILNQLRTRGKTIIGLHIRRGENGRYIFFNTPIGWCLKWLWENWKRFERPVLFLSVEEKEFVKPFEKYNPILIEDLGYVYQNRPPAGYKYPHGESPVFQRQMNFLGDWLCLKWCDVVLSSESTYSFTAAWLSYICKEFWRPRLSLGGFEKVDPWNTHFSPREDVADFPGIPGTTLDTNPHWEREGWTPEHDHPRAVPEDPATYEQWMEPPR